MKQQAGLVLALATAAPAVAGDQPPEARLLPDPGNTAALAARASAEGAEAALAEGRAYLATNNAVQAISAFRLALAADASSVAALNGLGIAYDRLGRSDLARRHFEMALAIEPDAGDIAYNLGWSLHLAGDDRGAVPWLQRASGSDDGRAAAAARRVLALIAARLEAEASGALPLPATGADPLADQPIRVASARIDMASTGEAVLVLPGSVPHPAASRPVLALSVPVEQVITAAALPLAATPADAAGLDIMLPQVAGPEALAANAAADGATADGAAAAETAAAEAVAPAGNQLNSRLGTLAALTIPLAVAAPLPAVAGPALPPPVVEVARVAEIEGEAADRSAVEATEPPAPLRKRLLRRATAVVGAVVGAPASPAVAEQARPAPRVIALGTAASTLDIVAERVPVDAAADTPDPVLANTGDVPPLRLLDLAALPLLATATPTQPLPLLTPPRLAVDWLAGTDIDHLAPDAERPAYRRLMDALTAQADLADAVDPQAVRMAISRLEALVARIELMSREVLRA